MPPEERRRADDGWRAEVDRRLDEGDRRMSAIETELTKNTDLTKQTHAGVAELLEVFKALKGAATVTGWLGSLVKWAAAILVAGGIILYVWKTGDLPRKT